MSSVLFYFTFCGLLETGLVIPDQLTAVVQGQTEVIIIVKVHAATDMVLLDCFPILLPVFEATVNVVTIAPGFFAQLTDFVRDLATDLAHSPTP